VARRVLDDGGAGWAARLIPGERQLVSEARVVRRWPRFAVLDEPSSALDEVSESRMFAALRATGAGVLAAGHKHALRRACDAVVTI
jgi:vitamin B12/bleomycin/antimicrobial peptide transport system ATP-binding/permease protein